VLKGVSRVNDSGDSNAWVNVYEFLKERIIKGVYSPGEKLNEREIAKLVNVSRTPAREALRILEHEGFVTNVSKKGVFVKKYSPAELDTLHMMLIRLEGLAVEMAASRLSEKDLDTLEKMNRRLKELALKKNYADYLTLNIDFHLFFPKATQSAELFDTISQLRKRVFRFYYTQIIVDEKFEQYVKDHQEIVDALRGKTGKKPEKLMEKHIESGRRSFLNFYKRFGG
jgi:DNA-binding GntR family transcriptional regulator